MAGIRTYPVGCAVAIATFVMISMPALGQTELRPVDAGTSRSGLMAAPGRAAPTDLRAPSAFDRVYRVMNKGKDSGDFARVQGGIYAVYSGSQSTGTNSNEVPAGTVFYIGAPRSTFHRPAPDPSALQRAPRPRSPAGERAPTGAPLSNSARGTVTVPTPIRSADVPPVPLTIFTNEVYRARLVSTLLDRALAIPKS